MNFALWLCFALVFYVYIGYPCAIFLRARSKSRAVPPDHCDEAQFPFLTVLIPAHNEEKWIRRKIENALELGYPRDRFQVLVASDGCTDGTVSIAEQFSAQGVEVSHIPQRKGKTATLNRVVPTSRGEIVLLTDANALLGKDVAKLLVRHFQDPQVGCVTGERVCLPTESSASTGEGLYWRYESWIKHSESRLGSCLGSNGQVLAFRKALFPVIPVIGDDFFIPMKILISTGAKVLFEPKAKAWIPAASSLRLELERKVRAHVSLFRDLPHLGQALNPFTSSIWWRFLSHHILRLFVPFAMIVAFLLSAFLWNAGSVYRFVLLAQCVFYACAAVGFLLQRVGIRTRVFYVPFYFVFANLGVLLSWFRWARGKHQYAWQRTERILPQMKSAEGPHS